MYSRSSTQSALRTELREAREWSGGRMWIPRALLLAYLVYALLRFLKDPGSSTMFSGITFAFHELGHVVFGFAGHFVSSLMGSGTQVLIPIVAGMMLWKQQGDYFGAAVCGFWLSFSLFELAVYVADARAMDLPLVGMTSDPEHDWHYLLSRVGLLGADTFLAVLIRVAATAIGAASLWFAAWLLWQMHRLPAARRSI